MGLPSKYQQQQQQPLNTSAASSSTHRGIIAPSNIRPGTVVKAGAGGGGGDIGLYDGGFEKEMIGGVRGEAAQVLAMDSTEKYVTLSLSDHSL